MSFAAKQNGMVDKSERSEGAGFAVAQPVLGDLFVFPAGQDDCGHTGFILKVDSAISQ